MSSVSSSSSSSSSSSAPTSTSISTTSNTATSSSASNHHNNNNNNFTTISDSNSIENGSDSGLRALGPLGPSSPSSRMKRLLDFSNSALSTFTTILMVPFGDVDDNTKRLMLVEGKQLNQVLTTSFIFQTLFLFLGAFVVAFTVSLRNQRITRGLTSMNRAMMMTTFMQVIAVSFLPFMASIASKNRMKMETSKERNKDDEPDLQQVKGLEIDAMVFYAVIVCICAARTVLEKLFMPYRVNPLLGKFYVTEATCELVLSGVLMLLALPLPGDYRYLLFLLLPLGTVIARAIYHFQFTMDVFKVHIQTFTDGVLSMCAIILILRMRPTTDCASIVAPETCMAYYSQGCRAKLSATQGLVCYFDESTTTSRTLLLGFAYLVTFIFIAMFWAKHQVLFERFYGRKLDGLTVYLNSIFCCFLGLIPFSFAVVNNFALQPVRLKEGVTPDKIIDRLFADPSAPRTACIFACTVVLCASLLLIAMLVMAYIPRFGRPAPMQSKMSDIPSQVLARFAIVPTLAVFNLLLLAIGWEVSIIPLLLAPVSMPIIWLWQDNVKVFSDEEDDDQEDNSMTEPLGAEGLDERGGSRGGGQLIL